VKRLGLRILFLLMIIFFLIFLYYLTLIWSAAHRTYDPPEQSKSDKRTRQVSIDKDPVSLLLLGVDEREGDLGRSDTMIIASINPNKKSVILTQIPRDTRAEIPGRGRKEKINHSYAYGGVDLTRQTVENFLDFPIDGYVKVNMDGLKDIVDELGGIEVNVPFDFTYDGKTFTQGPMVLDGDEALAFTRMRKADPNGDFGRMKRQQEVIRGIIKKGTSWTSFAKLHHVIDDVGNNIKTDISPFQLFKLQTLYSNIPEKNIQTLSFRGHGKMIGGVYYYIIPPEEISRVRKLLLNQVELEDSPA